MSLLAAAFLLVACESDTGVVASTDDGGGGTGGPLPGSVQELIASVGDRVFFAYDRSDLSPQARTTIEGWATWLKANPGVSISVQGHADERGTREYNLALGDRRANAVKTYMAALGVSAGSVQTISYGKERPQDPGHTEAAWATNRRGVFVAPGVTN